MYKKIDHRKGYAITLLFSALAGGVLVALATRAIPRMMSRMMSGMMQSMMSQMRESGCDPSEM